jgi:hypothetical protein
LWIKNKGGQQVHKKHQIKLQQYHQKILQQSIQVLKVQKHRELADKETLKQAFQDQIYDQPEFDEWYNKASEKNNITNQETEKSKDTYSSNINYYIPLAESKTDTNNNNRINSSNIDKAIIQQIEPENKTKKRNMI